MFFIIVHIFELSTCCIKNMNSVQVPFDNYFPHNLMCPELKSPQVIWKLLVKRHKYTKTKPLFSWHSTCIVRLSSFNWRETHFEDNVRCMSYGLIQIEQCSFWNIAECMNTIYITRVLFSNMHTNLVAKKLWKPLYSNFTWLL